MLSRERLEAVGPAAVATYLRSRGWDLAEEDERTSVWTRRDAELTLPLHRELRDFALRVSEVLDTLEGVETRDRRDILEDIVRASADVVRLRLAGPELEDGHLPLVQGGEVVVRMRALFEAAACSAVSARPLHGARRPTAATAWVEGLKLAPPQSGSCVLRVLSEVPPALEPQGSLLLSEEPFARQATATLLQALAEARQAATRAAGTGEAQPFEAAVARGVSANLCEAIATIVDAARARTLEVGVQWAAHRFAPPGVPDQVLIDADLAPVLREAGRVLRARAPKEDFELEGHVVQLARPEGADVGLVTVAGLVQDQLRKVRLELAGADYQRAVDAHRDGRRVRCLGTLIREARGFTLHGPHRFEVLVGPAAGDD